jgi:hypothetical protein
VYYSGAIEVQPPLSDAHAKLVEAFVYLEDSEDLRPTPEAIKLSEEPDLPYHGGQMYISEDRSKIEACQGEQRHGLRLWVVHLVKHFFIPQGYTLNGEISWDASDDLEDRGCIYTKDNAIEAVDFLIFEPGPSWEHRHFADEGKKRHRICLPARTTRDALPTSRWRRLMH